MPDSIGRALGLGVLGGVDLAHSAFFKQAHDLRVGKCPADQDCPPDFLGQSYSGLGIVSSEAR